MVSLRAGAVHLCGDGREVDQLVHGRQVGYEAPQFVLALIPHEQVLATPDGRGLDARLMRASIVTDHSLSA